MRIDSGALASLVCAELSSKVVVGPLSLALLKFRKDFWIKLWPALSGAPNQQQRHSVIQCLHTRRRP